MKITPEQTVSLAAQSGASATDQVDLVVDAQDFVPFQINPAYISLGLAPSLFKPEFLGPPPPPNVKPENVRQPRPPKLFMRWHHVLATLRGDFVRGDLLTTLPAMTANTTTTHKVIVTKKTSTEIARSTTVLDGESQRASSQFNNQMQTQADSRFGRDQHGYEMQASFHGEGSMGFGSASASANLDVSGSTNDVREEFAQAVEHTLAGQVSDANEARRETVTVGSANTRIDQTTQTETTVTRKNESDHPVNEAVFQVKQQMVSCLCLTNVELEFQGALRKDNRRVPLTGLAELLDAVIADGTERVVIAKQICDVLARIRDFQDVERSLLAPESSIPMKPRVNTRLTSKLALKNSDGSVRRELSVDGIILRSKTYFLAKPNTTVVLPIV